MDVQFFFKKSLFNGQVHNLKSNSLNGKDWRRILKIDTDRVKEMLIKQAARAKVVEFLDQ